MIGYLIYCSFTGFGFVDELTTVEIGGVGCYIISNNGLNIVCRSAAHSVGKVALIVNSIGYSYPKKEFEYTLASTPLVQTISPNKGKNF